MQSLTHFKLARMKAGLRQMDVARALDISESLVTKWETQRSRPGECFEGPLEKLLGVPFAELIADLPPRKTELAG